MNQKSFFGLMALFPFLVGMTPSALAATTSTTTKTVTGFDCVVDLPDKLVSKNPTGLSSDTVDNTYKMAGRSAMSCDSKGNMVVLCGVRLTQAEVTAMAGKSGTSYTYTNIAKCSFDRTICPSATPWPTNTPLVKSQKSVVTIRQIDDSLPLLNSEPKNRWVAGVACQYP